MHGRNRARGSGAGYVRSGEGELRTVARCFLESARPDASEPPGTGLWHAVSHGDFHSFAGAGSDCQEVAGRAGSRRKTKAARRNGDHARRRLLSRGRISPEIPAEARRSELPLLKWNPI